MHDREMHTERRSKNEIGTERKELSKKKTRPSQITGVLCQKV